MRLKKKLLQAVKIEREKSGLSFDSTDALKLTGCKVINNKYVKVEPGTLTKAE